LDRRLLPPHGQARGILILALVPAAFAAEDAGRTNPDLRARQSPAPRAGPDSPPGPKAPDSAAAASAPDREPARAALSRGLAWLAGAAATTPDGSMPPAGATVPATVATTALAALAWMAGGSAPDRGPQGKELGLAIDWIAAHTDLDPQSETQGYISLGGDGVSRMHGHGFATLALTQAAGLSPKSERGARVDRALRAALQCIQRSQGVEGGWWYEPKKSLEHEGSITVCEVQALRAAHNAGYPVDPLTIGRALDYLARSQKTDGSFRYALGEDRSTLALTAAAIATLNAAGKYEGKPLEEAYGYLFRGLSAREGWIERHPDAPLADRRLPEEKDARHAWCGFYERLVLAQALWQCADRGAFERWNAAETRILLASQRPDGSWHSDPQHDESFGDAYATATNCLVLALPEGLLPIFQR
jgi:hypothetical protein